MNKFTFNCPDQELRDIGVGPNHIWCKNIPKEHIKLKKSWSVQGCLVQHSDAPIPISPLICTYMLKDVLRNPGPYTNMLLILHYSFCILKNGGTSERYTENFLQMATIVFLIAFVPLQTSDSNGKKCVVVVVAPMCSFMKSGQKIS